jgi:hypothetical protein
VVARIGAQCRARMLQPEVVVTERRRCLLHLLRCLPLAQ